MPAVAGQFTDGHPTESIFIIFGGGMYVAKNTFHGAECASAASARSAVQPLLLRRPQRLSGNRRNGVIDKRLDSSGKACYTGPKLLRKELRV